MITGLGMVTPSGRDAAQSWQGVTAGRSTARWLTPEDVGLTSWDSIANPPRWIGCPAEFEFDRTPAADRVAALGLSACREALADAALERSQRDPERIGCVFGTSKGSLFAASAGWRSLHSQQRSDANPQDHAAWWSLLSGPALAADAVAHAEDLRGPRLSPVAACATGLVAVIQAAALLRQSACDVVLAGSADDSLHPLVLASFQRMGVLAQSAQPATASRPYDRHRNGFVIGAGAGCLVLERKSHAERRGARWYAEVAHGRLGSDPTGMASLDASGDALARLIADACRFDGQLVCPDVFNLHGTGTRLNDAAECRAVRQVFGGRALSSASGSLKGGLGHLLGAAGSVELALCCLMLRDQTVPPNVNLEAPDTACNLTWARHPALSRPIQSILKLSLGFGGHQTAVWLNRGNR